MPKMATETGRVGIVTGGGSGIGRAIAVGLARSGARVLICGRRAAALEAAALEAQDARGKIEIVPGDLLQSSTLASLEAKVRGAGGKLHFLVNNAGVSGMNPLDGPPEEDAWDRILETNLAVPYRLIRSLAPLMPEGGRILNVSSVLGKFGVAGYSAYCASKHGLIGMTRALALELAPRKITVNAICPGWVETDMARSGMESISRRLGIPVEQFRSEALARVPMGRMLRSEEIVPLALYLLSEESAMMTGQALNLCGGATTA
jgi:NAD(P)-dependent dehydrogenase (short-subunit alcohol dehydrogenase family)